MPGSTSNRRKRSKGAVQQLASGGLRVSVYAGVDPLTKRRHYLRETVPAGPNAAGEAERVMRRLANQVDERRHPRTKATVDQLLDRHFEMVTIERSTLGAYRGYADKHIRPLIGSVQVGALDADLFDSFYAELRRCRDHCTRKRQIDHRTPGPHECDDRCGPHTCRPLSAASIRQIHYILSGALKRAVRWRWVATNPIAQAEPPPAPKPNPQPPTAAEAGRILAAAWAADPDWGTLIWLAIVTGARRGELCALRWRNLDIDNALLVLASSIGQRGTEMWEKDTKTHQHRRIALDPETVDILTEHRARWLDRTEALGVELSPDAFVFSNSPDGSTHLRPNSVGERYGDLATRLDIRTSLHKLRHYSATELITAGVDVRTVAGRLGHGGGGTTTLRVYAAWVSETDQRAARSLFSRMPERPREPHRRRAVPIEPTPDRPLNPYEEIAYALRAAIADGTHPIGAYVPAVKTLATEHSVSVGTAHRALSLLADWGLVAVVAGHGFQVTEPAAQDLDELLSADPPGQVTPRRPDVGPERQSVLLELTVLHRGQEVSRFSAAADPHSAEDLQDLLLDAITRRGGSEGQVHEYEMQVRRSGKSELITTFIAPRLRNSPGQPA